MRIHNIYDQNLLEPGYYPVIQSYYYNEFKRYDMRQHLHERMEIMYVIKGECIVRSKKDRIRLLSGDFIFINSTFPHALRVENDRGCMVLNIEFVFEKLESLAPDFTVLHEQSPQLRAMLEQRSDYLRIKDNGEMYRILFSIVEHMDIKVKSNFVLDLWMAQFLLSMASLADARSGSSKIDYVQAAKDYVARNYSHEIHVSDIANFIHIHPAYLQRLFKKECGVSVVDYLNDIRVQKAYHLLTRTNMSIIDIANSVGINSQQYFTRLFKKATNTTPKALRDSSMSDSRLMEPLDREVNWVWRGGLGETTYEVESDWQESGADSSPDANPPKSGEPSGEKPDSQ